MDPARMLLAFFKVDCDLCGQPFSIGEWRGADDRRAPAIDQHFAPYHDENPVLLGILPLDRVLQAARSAQTEPRGSPTTPNLERKRI